MVSDSTKVLFANRKVSSRTFHASRRSTWRLYLPEKSKQEEGECNEVDKKASKRIRNACHSDSQLVCSTPNRVRAIHAE